MGKRAIDNYLNCLGFTSSQIEAGFLLWEYV